jgi:hypothetical protein
MGWLIEACGLIPTFFARAIIAAPSDATVDEIAMSMDELYTFGGFKHPLKGKVENNIYKSPYEDDEDLYPYMKMITNIGITCLIYPYGIVALVGKDNKQLLTRMD